MFIARRLHQEKLIETREAQAYRARGWRLFDVPPSVDPPVRPAAAVDSPAAPSPDAAAAVPEVEAPPPALEPRPRKGGRR